MSSFVLRVETGATDKTPQDVARELVEVAKRLSLNVVTKINGIEIMVYPQSTPEQAARAYTQAVERRLKFNIAI